MLYGIYAESKNYFLEITFQCWFGHTLRKYIVHDWSIEQKWLALLLPLLILYDSKIKY